MSALKSLKSFYRISSPGSLIRSFLFMVPVTLKVLVLHCRMVGPVKRFKIFSLRFYSGETFETSSSISCVFWVLIYVFFLPMVGEMTLLLSSIMLSLLTLSSLSSRYMDEFCAMLVLATVAFCSRISSCS